MKKILVTGGAGYIGSHTLVELINKGYECVVIDNFSNSSIKAIKAVEEITKSSIIFYEGDIRNIDLLNKIFSENEIYSVIHFAGLKAVGESCTKPLEYYDNNVYGTVCLLEAMKKANCKNIIFSSSATVYGIPKEVPIKEDAPLSFTNPYGGTKLTIENMLKDLYSSDNEWSITLLRYFNPVGAHTSGLIGEDPKGIPNNLMPYVARVAAGILPYIHVYGNDYDTKDGTGVRDYIHVVDLALGHIAALDKCSSSGLFIYNLGTGEGYSVLDMINAFSKACGKDLPYQIEGRRPGDIATSIADATKAYNELGWKALRNLYDMCLSTWNFQNKKRD